MPTATEPEGRPVNSGHYFWNGKAKKNSLLYRGERLLRSVFERAGIQNAHAHRFRHTLAVALLVHGASFEDVAIILGNSPNIVRKYYASWTPSRQQRISDLM